MFFRWEKQQLVYLLMEMIQQIEGMVGVMESGVHSGGVVPNWEYIQFILIKRREGRVYEHRCR